jgi:hypothetical protein
MVTTNSYRSNLGDLVHGMRVNRALAFGIIITTALLAFEIFNYGTTDYALTDLLGELEFAGLRWATILAIAFCGIDFAGIARLFAPELGRNQNENWFLFGAWLLAATMNAMLTWWGVSLAILNHQAGGGDMIVARDTMIRVGPVFVAVLVWLIRVLIIGTFSISGERLFNNEEERLAHPAQAARLRPLSRPAPAAVREEAPARPPLTRPRPTHPLSGQNTPVERAPLPQRAAPTPAPRYAAAQPEPEYTEDEETGYNDPNPRYERAPLAARSNSRPLNNPSRSLGDGSNSRSPVPRQRS